jgi:hypothetical protein
MISRTFAVTLVNRAPNLMVSPSALNFNITSTLPASPLSQTVIVSDDLNSGQASEAVAWILQGGEARDYEGCRAFPHLSQSIVSKRNTLSVDATVSLACAEKVERGNFPRVAGAIPLWSRLPVLTPGRTRYNVRLKPINDWFRAKVEMASFTPEEMFGTKLRALLQRRNNRETKA